MKTIRNDELLVTFPTAQGSIDLEHRLESAADEVRQDGETQKVFVYNGRFSSSQNEVRIASSTYAAVILIKRIAQYGLFRQLPEKLQEILGDYHARPTESEQFEVLGDGSMRPQYMPTRKVA